MFIWQNTNKVSHIFVQKLPSGNYRKQQGHIAVCGGQNSLYYHCSASWNPKYAGRIHPEIFLKSFFPCIGWVCVQSFSWTNERRCYKRWECDSTVNFQGKLRKSPTDVAPVTIWRLCPSNVKVLSNVLSDFLRNAEIFSLPNLLVSPWRLSADIVSQIKAWEFLVGPTFRVERCN